MKYDVKKFQLVNPLLQSVRNAYVTYRKHNGLVHASLTDEFKRWADRVPIQQAHSNNCSGEIGLK
jgi:hypothetical protein